MSANEFDRIQENMVDTCKLYWYTGILKGVEVVTNRPHDYQVIVKSVQDKVDALEEKLNKKEEEEKK